MASNADHHLNKPGSAFEERGGQERSGVGRGDQSRMEWQLTCFVFSDILECSARDLFTLPERIEGCVEEVPALSARLRGRLPTQGRCLAQSPEGAFPHTICLHTCNVRKVIVMRPHWQISPQKTVEISGTGRGWEEVAGG